MGTQKMRRQDGVEILSKKSASQQGDLLRRRAAKWIVIPMWHCNPHVFSKALLNTGWRVALSAYKMEGENHSNREQARVVNEEAQNRHLERETTSKGGRTCQCSAMIFSNFQGKTPPPVLKQSNGSGRVVDTYGKCSPILHPPPALLHKGRRCWECLGCLWRTSQNHFPKKTLTLK